MLLVSLRREPTTYRKAQLVVTGVRNTLRAVTGDQVGGHSKIVVRDEGVDESENEKLEVSATLLSRTTPHWSDRDRIRSRRNRS